MASSSARGLAAAAFAEPALMVRYLFTGRGARLWSRDYLKVMVNIQ